jgi:hypothetical protein
MEANGTGSDVAELSTFPFRNPDDCAERSRENVWQIKYKMMNIYLEKGFIIHEIRRPTLETGS